MTFPIAAFWREVIRLLNPLDVDSGGISILRPLYELAKHFLVSPILAATEFLATLEEPHICDLVPRLRQALYSRRPFLQDGIFEVLYFWTQTQVVIFNVRMVHVGENQLQPLARTIVFLVFGRRHVSNFLCGFRTHLGPSRCRETPFRAARGQQLGG